MSGPDGEGVLAARETAGGVAPGAPTRPAARNGPSAHRRSRWIWVAGYGAASLLLFLCYLRISGTVSVNSDGGNTAMQAWDMLHGNWLLHGWVLGDASYYTTELPEYVLVERVLGLSPAVVHVSAAITYTLLVVLAGLLAKAGTKGKEALVRVLIASGIMIAPQLGPGASALLVEPNHTGTAVPLLLTFILLDRAAALDPARGRWWVPAAIGLLLVWGQIADLTVATMGVLPVIVVYGVRAYRGVIQRREPVSAHSFDLALIAAAVVSVGVAHVVEKVIARLGGYAVLPVHALPAPTTSWPAHIATAIAGVLRLYGAAFSAGVPRFATVLSVVHLVGLALAVWALSSVVRRFFSYGDPIAQVLTVAIVLQLALYTFSTLPYAVDQDHEIAIVLPFGAVLAGRVLAGRLTQARLLPAMTVVACGYLIALGYGVMQQPAPTHDAALSSWLSARHLTGGIGTYTEVGSVDIDSHGTISMALAVLHKNYASRGDLFEETAAAFDPRLHYVNFVVSTKQDGPTFYTRPSWYIRIFGKPVHTYHYEAWTIMIWNKNLLDQIR